MKEENNLSVNIDLSENKEEQKHEEKNEENGKSKWKKNLITIIKVVVMAIIGFFFGFILEKSKVYEPRFIRQQMIFNKFLMMKMFLSALATSSVSIFILNFVAKERYNKVFESYRTMLKSKSLLIVSAGGLILGLGMTVGGSCPGMVFVQLGAGVNYSYLTLVGGLMAGLVHGLLNTYLTGSSKADPITSKTLFEVIKVNAIIVRIVFIVLLAVGVALMEVFVPWKKDYTFKDSTRPFFSVTSEVWQPIIGGCCLGSLQFFSLLLLSKSLGSSSAFSSLASFILSKEQLENFPYLKRFRGGLSNIGTLGFVFSVLMGSFTSSNFSGVFAKAQPVHPYNAVLGGFLLVFGARLAGGCNTGHGISGTSHLFIGSIVAMMSMFASGILLGFFALTNEFYL